MDSAYPEHGPPHRFGTQRRPAVGEEKERRHVLHPGVKVFARDADRERVGHGVMELVISGFLELVSPYSCVYTRREYDERERDLHI